MTYHDPSQTPLTLLETTNAPAGDFRGVASSIQGPHSPPAGFPAPPLCQPKPAAAAAVRVYLKPSRASRFAVRGQPPPWQLATCTILSSSLGPGLAVYDDGGGRGEGGNQLFRKTRSDREEKARRRREAFEEGSEQSRVLEAESQVRSPEVLGGKDSWQWLCNAMVRTISSCLDSEIARVEARLKLKSWRVGA